MTNTVGSQLDVWRCPAEPPLPFTVATKIVTEPNMNISTASGHMQTTGEAKARLLPHFAVPILAQIFTVCRTSFPTDIRTASDAALICVVAVLSQAGRGFVSSGEKPRQLPALGSAS